MRYRSRRLIGALGDGHVGNPVILSGDNHRHWVAELKSKPEDQETPVIATEYIGGSIASRGDGSEMTNSGRRILKLNPHFKYFFAINEAICCAQSRPHNGELIIASCLMSSVREHPLKRVLVSSQKTVALALYKYEVIL